MELILSSAWLLISAWLITRAFRQRDVLKSISGVPAPPPDLAADVDIIVPARDEGANIRLCLERLIAQDYPAAKVRLLVVNDNSRDDTAAIVIDMAARWPRIQPLRSRPLPDRWIGKSHACWLAFQATRPEATWLCFVDADVYADPPLLSSIVATAERKQLDLLSVAPRHVLESFAERLVIPCGFYLLAFLQDLGRNLDAESVTGQCMLVRRSAYQAAGGHAAVRTAISEDVALARNLASTGGRIEVRSGRHLVATRMYTGWRSLWLGFSKNAVDLFGGPMATLAIAIVAVMLAWAAFVIPIVDALGCLGQRVGACWALPLSALGTVAAFGLHLGGSSYFAIPFWYGLLFPVGYTVGALIALDSVRRRLTGRVVWKGRAYP